MKKFVLLLILILLNLKSYAQSDTSLKDYNYLYYSALDRSYMQTDILIQRAIPFSSISFADGKYDTVTNYSDVRQMYHEIQIAAWEATAITGQPQGIAPTPKTIIFAKINNKKIYYENMQNNFLYDVVYLYQRSHLMT